MTNAVSVTNLHKNYAGEHALAGISFNVPVGGILGIVGADGAGKSTLLRIATTLTTPDSGTVTVLGCDVVSGYRELRHKIGYMPQKFSLYQDLSVRENLVFFADIFGLSKKNREQQIARLLEFSRLAPFQSRRSRDLSGGMKQKLALSCTLIHTPEIIFLDEPTTGVDPVSRQEFWNILFDLKKQGVTIVVSTPYMDEAQECDELLIMDKGRLLKHGTPQSLNAEYPYALFRIESSTTMLTYPHDGLLPEGCLLMYPSAGALHVAAAKNTMNEARMLSRIQTILPDASACTGVTPGVEDLFVFLLSKPV
jgi:ABC-type multidrug transport system ATPase subunit